jgi:antitoxin component HigA of HigAB toxin-antitoxin module
MQIRPIRNDKDHRAALAEIEKLWGASIGTPDGDKLDILVTLVETYEERRWPLKSRRRFDPGCAALCDRGTRSQSGGA